MKPIFIKSPKNERKVLIGEIDLFTRTAYFYINEARHFQEADAIGIDLKVFNRKAVRWCEQIMFRLWDGRKIRILRQEFAQHSWIYPPGKSQDYKAASPGFVPKLMITIEKAEKLNNWNEETSMEEMARQGVFG